MSSNFQEVDSVYLDKLLSVGETFSHSSSLSWLPQSHLSLITIIKWPKLAPLSMRTIRRFSEGSTGKSIYHLKIFNFLQQLKLLVTVLDLSVSSGHTVFILREYQMMSVFFQNLSWCLHSTSSSPTSAPRRPPICTCITKTHTKTLQTSAANA